MPMDYLRRDEIGEVVYFHVMGEGSDLSKAAQRLSIPLWGRLLIWALVGIVPTAATGFVLGFIRLGKIESAVRVLASKADQNVHDLVKDLLAEAYKDNQSGDVSRAEKALSIIPIVLTRAKNEGIPAPPSYFKSSVDDLDALQSHTSSKQVIEEVRRSRVVFAEYRSKLRPPITPDPKANYVLVPYPFPPGNQFKFDARYGIVFDLRNVPVGMSILGSGAPPYYAGAKSDDPEHPIFFENGTQRLDNTDWINVVFSHMVIQYSGGHTLLRNVKFVNCTFELASGVGADNLATYVALELSEVTLPS